VTDFTPEFYDGYGAVIFDMDGLLIDSEPLWWRAEIKVLQAVGVPLTTEMCWETMGTRVDEMVAHWFELYPWEGPSVAETASAVLEEVRDLILAEGVAMPGAVELVGALKKQGRVLAVASSSPRSLIDAVLATLGLTGSFAALYTADDEAFGKPDPAVYVSAARGLGVEPGQCLVFEDSTAGMIAGKGAGMVVVAVSPEDRGVDTSVADIRVDSLVECLRGSDQ
jgi:mannitol-1-/sugar-/sorbitol-6-/2-deoxyglucose-6-phosphatase